MKQIMQNLKTGETVLEKIPAPSVRAGHVLIQTTNSLVSTGTEKMLVEFGHANIVQKARQQPDKVKMVLDKMRSDGLIPTVEAVFKKLDGPLPLGYCNAGKVIEIGKGVLGFKKGDRVASNGQHAEIVCVPENLCAKIPDRVQEDEACFTVMGAIALQGLRLANPTLGEKFVVYGTGLIGLMVVQLLRASGCHVLAIDLNDQRLGLAESFGAKVCNAGSGDPISMANTWTEKIGVDGVIIAASAKSDLIIHQTAKMCRKRARIILIGDVSLNLQRADFYEKEITFQVSCSYGPGRYDDSYEKNGQDYPIGFVRWTEQRNFQAVLVAMAEGKLDVSRLITDRLQFDDAGKVYEKICNDPSALGVILQYPNTIKADPTIWIAKNQPHSAEKCVAAMIGAGNYAKMIMGPALAKTDARLKFVSARTNGATAAHLAKKYGFENATTDLDQLMADPEVNTIFITTRHNSHAKLVCTALEAGKHLFVEKPICITEEELYEIVKAYSDIGGLDSVYPQVMVGFNRRFSPHIKKIKELLSGRGEPLTMNFSCNAGIVPPDVWVHDPKVGGGRIIGEACHFIDLLSFIAGSRIISVCAAQVSKGVAIKEDKMAIILTLEDGSIGTVNYYGNGSKKYPKETMEIYSEGRILRLENFRKLTGFGFKGFRNFKTRKMDKGHQKEFQTFVEQVQKGGEPLMTMDEIVNITLACFAAVTSARETRTIHIDEEYQDIQNVRYSELSN